MPPVKLPIKPSLNEPGVNARICKRFDYYLHTINKNMYNHQNIQQVRRYRIMIKKFINAYSGKIIKIYQRCGLLSRDSLSLGEPYPTKKMVLPLKVINIYNIIIFKAQAPLMGPPEGKSLEIYSVSLNINHKS